MDTVTGGMLVLPATAETVAGFMAAAEAAPEELSTIANVMTAPPMPFIPEEHHGEVVILAMLVHAGPTEDGEQAAPFRALATPLADMVRPMTYPEIYPPEDPEYRPLAAARTMFVDTIGHAEAELILEHLRASTAMMAAAQLRPRRRDGRVPADATAFAHRQSRIMVNVAAIYETLDEASVHEDWVTQFAAALRQSDDGMYVNFVGDEGEAAVRAAYPEPRGSDSRRPNAGTTPATSSASTRTSRPRPRDDRPASSPPAGRADDRDHEPPRRFDRRKRLGGPRPGVRAGRCARNNCDARGRALHGRTAGEDIRAGGARRRDGPFRSSSFAPLAASTRLIPER